MAMLHLKVKMMELCYIPALILYDNMAIFNVNVLSFKIYDVSYLLLASALVKILLYF